jgi:TPR repeat protein
MFIEMCYFWGQGVPMDKQYAEDWLRQAAQHGHELAAEICRYKIKNNL